MESSPYFYEDKVHCDNGSAFCLQRAKKKRKRKKKERNLFYREFIYTELLALR